MAIAVFDIGKTNIKLSVVTEDGEILARRSAPNRQIQDGAYNVMDLNHTEHFLFEGLRAFGQTCRLDDIITTTHGCLGYLVLRDGTVHSLPDYECVAPDDVQAEYAAVADPYPARGSRIMKGVLHATCQLLWCERRHPKTFENAAFFLGGPQFWAWRLSGVAASEVTTLAALSHLWDVPKGTFAPIVSRMGWQRLLPDVRPSWEALGPLTAELCADLGLPHRPRIHCGLHDSSANFYRCQAAGEDKLTLLSSGTWLVGFSNEAPVPEAGEQWGVSLNADVTGHPINCALSMAGREYAIIGEMDRLTEPTEASLDDVMQVIAERQFALPSFTEADGFFPNSGLQGHFVSADGDAIRTRLTRTSSRPPDRPAMRRGLALLYIALNADVALDQLGSKGQIVVDGPFAQSPLFASLLAQLRPGQDIRLEDETAGATVGAALVVNHLTRDAPVHDVSHRPAPLAIPGLAAYRAEWRAHCAHYFDSPLSVRETCR